MSPGQAGFCRTFSTVDHIFTLRCMIEQSRSRGRRLYCCFVDFRKAFDTVPRGRLFQRLTSLGVPSEMTWAIYALYERVSGRVRCPGGLSDSIASTIGVKQGCPLSPTLFGLYIDEVADFIHRGGGGGVDLSGTQIHIMLYADDIVLLAESEEDLQHHLRALESFCTQRGLSVNLGKTKVLIFHTSGTVRRRSTFLFEGSQIEVADSYVYLGITFTARSGRFSMTQAARDRTTRAFAALAMLERGCHQTHFQEPRTKGWLFDTLVTPALLYAAPVNATRGSFSYIVFFCRALMLGLMLHAKGRDILLQDNYGEALEVLSMSEEAFGLCDSKLLEAVDNVALLQIDIVWCYFMLKDMARIMDAGKRLSQAREGLRRSHGPHLERLRTLQGGFCPELAIYVRLELLEGVVAFHTGLFEASKRSMVSAQNKYNQLQVSDESLALLVSMGFSTTESQRALRVSGQDVNSAIEFVMEERRKNESRREEDRRLEKCRRDLKGYGKTESGKVVDFSKLDKLVTIGHEKLLAAEALRQTENDFNAALDILSDPSKNATLQSTLLHTRERSRKRLNSASVEELLAMGFPRDQAMQALQNASNVDEAITQLLHGGGGTEGDANVNAGSSEDTSIITGAESPLNVHISDGVETAVEEEIEDQRDLEMEEDIATKLTGDPLSEYDIDVRKEGEALLAYLELLSAKSSPR